MHRRLAVIALVVCAFVAGPGATTARAADPRHASVTLSQVASGFSQITSIVQLNDGTARMFITEDAGTIKVRTKTGAVSTYLDISSRVLSGGEQGLLGLAFSPGFHTNGNFFVDYTQSNGSIVIARYHATPSSNRASRTEHRLLVIPHPTNSNHNGGQLQFGPDGYLYIGVGDGGSGGDPPNNAQNRRVDLGKILRIDVNHSCGGHLYCIPSGNPYRGSSTYKQEIWDWGLRNPWRFSFDKSDGRLWIGDVGQGSWEEVDRVSKGAGNQNFGWRCWEGRALYTDTSACRNLHRTSPLHVYDHSNSRCAIIGGYVYRGAAYRSIANGIYVYGDYCTGEIFGIGLVGTQWYGALLGNAGTNLRTFAQGPSGEMYLGDENGVVQRLVFHAR